MKGATLDMRRGKRCPECGQRFGLEAMFCPFDGGALTIAEWSDSADALIGQTVDGRYVVVAIVGEGGMGKVYEVRHIALERPFAMKVLRRDLAREGDLADRFIQEAKTTASVRHPNIVSITDFGRLPDGVPYFVMELLVGQTLAAVLKAGGPVPAARAVRIIRQVAGALGAAHAASIVHRDLKPENVFLIGGMAGGVASDDVRVVDFGAAKILGSSRLTKTGIVFGTPFYMSPEQASGAPIDHRADIYALGVIMYEMFAGRVPFEADTYMGVLTQHMFVAPVPPSQVSAAARELGALEEITLRALEKKPEDRFSTMADLAAAIDDVVKFEVDGRVSVAPRLEGAAASRRSQAPPFRMADELEPPTLEEMRVASDSLEVPKRSRAPVWIALGAVGAAAALGIVLARSGHGDAPITQAAVIAPSPPRPSVSAVVVPPVAPLPSAGVADADAAAPPPRRPPVAAQQPNKASAPAAPPAPRAPPKCDPDDPFCRR